MTKRDVFSSELLIDSYFHYSSLGSDFSQPILEKNVAKTP